MVISLLTLLALQAPAVVGVTVPDAGADWFGIEVTVAGDPGAVVVYVSVPGEAAARVVPLGEDDGGGWSGIVPAPPQRTIGIEVQALFSDGSVAASGPYALGALGLPGAVFASQESPDGAAPSSRDATPLWIGSLAAAGAVLLAGAGFVMRKKSEES